MGSSLKTLVSSQLRILSLKIREKIGSFVLKKSSTKPTEVVVKMLSVILLLWQPSIKRSAPGINWHCLATLFVSLFAILITVSMGTFTYGFL